MQPLAHCALVCHTAGPDSRQTDIGEYFEPCNRVQADNLRKRLLASQQVFSRTAFTSLSQAGMTHIAQGQYEHGLPSQTIAGEGLDTRRLLLASPACPHGAQRTGAHLSWLLTTTCTSIHEM